MRLLLITNEAPFPANHGGRVDVWRRLRALRAQGFEVFLVFWCGDTEDEQPRAQDLARMREEVADLRVYVIHRRWRERAGRLLNLWRYPSHVASRRLDAPQRKSLDEVLRQFRPEAVWLESIYGGVLAREVAERHRIPLYCRSHNVEHQYMARQYAKAHHVKERLGILMNRVGLRAWETRLLSEADAFFDLSADDLAFWRSQGLTRGHLLPPLVDDDFAAGLSAPMQGPGHDVAYVGNLRTPNNVDGVLWFLQQVVPLLRQQRPDLSVVVAGSTPVPRVIEACAAVGARLVPSPADVLPWLRDARVLVNPVFAGSGVNIKSIEMLFTSARLVSTAQGLQGLPEPARQCFDVADTPQAFARAVLAGLAPTTGAADVHAQRKSAREAFGPASLRVATQLLGTTGAPAPRADAQA